MKATLIGGIIRVLNDHLEEKNKQLCKENLYSSQVPLHGGEMFFTLAFLSETELREIATAAGL